MIFSGDTVLPFKFNEKIFKSLDKDFLSKEKVVNLESLIRLEDMQKTTKGIALESDKSVVDFFNTLNVKSVSLANNHITDFDTSIDKQREFLKQSGIDSFGAGDDLESASKPFIFKQNSKEYFVFAFGWNVIGCNYASNDKKGVNSFEYEHIKRVLKSYKDSNIILTFHNNYEFELYPQPAHRKMFFDLVDDFNVKAIFCHHPHIVGGCEIYNDTPIFYSLGNFYIPEINYNGYDLRYSKEANIGLSVDFIEEDIILYWTFKDEDNHLQLIDKELLSESKKIKELTPFDGMNHDDYIKWFKKHRKKNKLLPIYKDYNNKFEDNLNLFLVKTRQLLIDTLVRLGVK